MKQLPAKHGSA